MNLQKMNSADDWYSSSKFRSCIHPNPPPCVSTIQTKRWCPTSELDRLLFVAWRSTSGGNRCELCCCSSRYIQFRAGHIIEEQASTHHILESARGASRNKRWRHITRTRIRFLGLIGHRCCFSGFNSILRTESRRMGLECEESICFRHGHLGSIGKRSGQSTWRVATAERC